jgi:hypothetical protein
MSNLTPSIGSLGGCGPRPGDDGVLTRSLAHHPSG